MNNLKKILLLIPFFILIICFGTYFYFHKKSNYLEITIIPSHFYYSNQERINPIIQFVQKNCITKEKVELNLKFDYLPISVITAKPSSGALATFFSDHSLIEINIYQYAYFSTQEQENLILHEIGHTLGLEHVGNEDNIMNSSTQQKDLKQSFSKTLSDHCSGITDVPRINY